MTLQYEEREAIINYRIEKADKAYQEAVDVAKLLHWNLAIQRLYYALYYLESALLLKDGKNASSHVGVKSLINLHFIKTGLLSSEDGNLIGRLFNMRQTGDYQDNFDWSEEDVAPFLPKVEILMDKLKKIIGTL